MRRLGKSFFYNVFRLYKIFSKIFTTSKYYDFPRIIPEHYLVLDFFQSTLHLHNFSTMLTLFLFHLFLHQPGGKNVCNFLDFSCTVTCNQSITSQCTVLWSLYYRRLYISSSKYINTILLHINMVSNEISLKNLLNDKLYSIP